MENKDYHIFEGYRHPVTNELVVNVTVGITHKYDENGDPACHLEAHTAYAPRLKYYFNYMVCPKLGHSYDVYTKDSTDLLTILNEARLDSQASRGFSSSTYEEVIPHATLEALIEESKDTDKGLFSVYRFMEAFRNLGLTVN